MAADVEAASRSVERLLEASYTAMQLRPYAVVEALVTVGRDAPELASAMPDDVGPAVTQLVERLLDRRGIKPAGAHVELAPPLWDLSGPAAVLADVFGEVMRAGHSFDLIHGSCAPVLVLLRAARHLDQHGAVGDDFEVAMEAANLVEARGGVHSLLLTTPPETGSW